MPKLYSSKHITTVLKKQGFTFISQKGSHGKFRKVSKGKTLTVIVPMAKREIPFGTFRSIMRQSQLDQDVF